MCYIVYPYVGTLYLSKLMKYNIILADIRRYYFLHPPCFLGGTSSNFEIFLCFVRYHFILQINILIKSTFLEKLFQGVQGAGFSFNRTPKKDCVIFLRLKLSTFYLDGIALY